MSNFMHKVKDAMTDHDKDTGRGFRAQEDTRFRAQDNQGSSNAPAQDYDTNQNRSSGMGSNNPYGSGSRSDDPNFNDTQNPTDSSRTGMGNQGDRSGDYGSTAMGGGGSNVNAGPHDSKMANKMDPRVDSDMDNRAARGTGNMNPQQSSNAPSNPSSGVDNHESTEDDYNKATQERTAKSQPQTGGYGNNPMDEESHSTSTQEHKTHSATSHTMPCQTNLQNEEGFENRGEPNFGGDAAGGSSYASGGQQPSGAQKNDDPMNKLDPRVTRSSGQANVGNQRSGY
jgi:hypothetical protein